MLRSSHVIGAESLCIELYCLCCASPVRVAFDEELRASFTVIKLLSAWITMICVVPISYHQIVIHEVGCNVWSSKLVSVSRDPSPLLFAVKQSERVILSISSGPQQIQFRTCLKKQSHNVPWRLRRERRYSSYSFMISGLHEDEWSASRPCRALPPVPIEQVAGWVPEPVWT
jgi:hypothetical protein